jgi:hypothetical protein
MFDLITNTYKRPRHKWDIIKALGGAFGMLMVVSYFTLMILILLEGVQS